jgi:hypothetical protein
MKLTKLAEEWAAANNKSDTLNANVGSDGTNVTYDKAQGNRGKQLNPNRHPTIESLERPTKRCQMTKGKFTVPLAGQTDHGKT